MIKSQDGRLQRFVEYIPINHRFHEKNLVVQMMRSSQTLEWVVDALFNSRKIKSMLKDNLNASRQEQSISSDVSSIRRRRSRRVVVDSVKQSLLQSYNTQVLS